MLDLFNHEETYRLEREFLDERNLLRATWHEREPRRRPASMLAGVRRQLARVLPFLADRLDPRAVVSVPHLPAAPTLNGTLHQA
jgi:hypothetical protein